MPFFHIKDKSNRMIEWGQTSPGNSFIIHDWIIVFLLGQPKHSAFLTMQDVCRNFFATKLGILYLDISPAFWVFPVEWFIYFPKKGYISHTELSRLLSGSDGRTWCLAAKWTKFQESGGVLLQSWDFPNGYLKLVLMKLLKLFSIEIVEIFISGLHSSP